MSGERPESSLPARLGNPGRSPTAEARNTDSAQLPATTAPLESRPVKRNAGYRLFLAVSAAALVVCIGEDICISTVRPPSLPIKTHRIVLADFREHNRRSGV